MKTPQEIMTLAYQKSGNMQGVHIDFNSCKERMSAAIQALKDNGYAIVPREPSEAMIGSSNYEHKNSANWQSMLEASEQETTQQAAGE